VSPYTNPIIRPASSNAPALIPPTRCVTFSSDAGTQSSYSGPHVRRCSATHASYSSCVLILLTTIPVVIHGHPFVRWPDRRAGIKHAELYTISRGKLPPERPLRNDHGAMPGPLTWSRAPRAPGSA